MRSGLAASAIATIVVIALTGCGTEKHRSPASARPSSTQTASPIPPIKSPRDVAVMARRTCELLTPQQATHFSLDSLPEPSVGLFDTVYCVWAHRTQDRELVRRVSITVMINNPTLEVAYTKDRSLPFFELTNVAGYPAIITRTNADLPSCDIDVKPAERQSFSLTYDSREFKNNPQQSCEVGKQVAAAVIMNLPLKR